jgi:hypothetical protein
VLALGLVELQCVRNAVEDHLAGTSEVAAFHPDVVVDAGSVAHLVMVTTLTWHARPPEQDH